MRVAVAAVLALETLSNQASAQTSPTIHDLRRNETVDAIVASTAGALWLGSELWKPHLAPSQCRWCDRNESGADTLNGLDSGVRSALRWSDTRAADVTSTVLGLGLMPGVAVGLDALAAWQAGADEKSLAVDALVIAETSFLAAGLNQLVKFAAGRERPFVHALAPEDRSKTAHPSDNNLSFYSGHTNWAFALAASSGTVASMRGYPLAPAIWTIGITLATVTGYLRIAADRHYFTDVAVGAVVGTAVGVALPLLLHPRSDAPLDAATMTALGSGSTFGFSGSF